MPATLLALQIFLILLPGFFAAYIVQALATRRSQSDLERAVEALVFSFAIYVCYVPINSGRLPFRFAQGSATGTSETLIWEPAQLGWLFLITIAFSFAGVAYIRFDGNRVFQWMRLTERTTRNSIWNDVFESEAIHGQPLQVELADGRSVLGKLHYYSDAAEDASIYLVEAAWVDANANTIPIPGSRILLTKSSGIRSVSLLDPPPESQGNEGEPAASVNGAVPTGSL
jgi:hypothetical protein